ncbi:hypothetical protein ONE63_005106 [Megalurothrips usitatus]|uniref:Histone deacetylase complex subunit SAP30 Sin3 binding domain-containing protein n=1 Tax=Megalurothrips usitatus TaxID=439358 RepID=A0AAV7XXT4_9NEOP|nr:hypothetical protein ONE63_005106 [Megalurothrips usitatus]
MEDNDCFRDETYLPDVEDTDSEEDRLSPVPKRPLPAKENEVEATGAEVRASALAETDECDAAPADADCKAEDLTARMRSILYYGRLGQRALNKCFHPACRDKDVLVQRLQRHYRDIHGKITEGNIRQILTLKEAHAMMSKYQPKTKSSQKIKHLVSESTILQCFSARVKDKTFLKKLRQFMEGTGTAVYKGSVRQAPRPKSAQVDEHVSDPDEPEGEPEKESKEDVSPKALGLNDH